MIPGPGTPGRRSRTDADAAKLHRSGWTPAPAVAAADHRRDRRSRAAPRAATTSDRGSAADHKSGTAVPAPRSPASSTRQGRSGRAARTSPRRASSHRPKPTPPPGGAARFESPGQTKVQRWPPAKRSAIPGSAPTVADGRARGGSDQSSQLQRISMVVPCSSLHRRPRAPPNRGRGALAQTDPPTGDGIRLVGKLNQAVTIEDRGGGLDRGFVCIVDPPAVPPNAPHPAPARRANRNAPAATAPPAAPARCLAARTRTATLPCRRKTLHRRPTGTPATGSDRFQAPRRPPARSPAAPRRRATGKPTGENPTNRSTACTNRRWPRTAVIAKTDPRPATTGSSRCSIAAGG